MEQIKDHKDHDFCLRCGRKLKNPEARKRGYGVICYKKQWTNFAHPLFEDEKNYSDSAETGERNRAL